MKQAKTIVLILLAFAILFQAVMTHQTAYVFGSESAVFNRAMYCFSGAYLLLAVSVLVFFKSRVLALVLALAAFLIAFTNTWTVTGSVRYVMGWFTFIPVGGLVWLLIERYASMLNKSNKADADSAGF